jgi:hypothetical protein
MIFERPLVWPLTIAGVVGYIALATYFDRTCVELRPSGKFVLLLNGPFTHEIGPAYWMSQLRPRGFLPISRLTIQLTRTIPPPPSTYTKTKRRSAQVTAHSKRSVRWVAATLRIGAGTGFSFLKETILNPNEYGRRYWAVVQQAALQCPEGPSGQRAHLRSTGQCTPRSSPDCRPSVKVFFNTVTGGSLRHHS